MRFYRGGLLLKVSIKRGNLYFCKLLWEGFYIFFKIFKMKLNKLFKNIGNCLLKGFG